MNGIEIRFYNPENADLNIRGRIKIVNRTDRLMMYTKIRSGLYEAIEMDTADTKGALYKNIWNLVWNTAIQPNNEELQSYIDSFKVRSK